MEEIEQRYDKCTAFVDKISKELDDSGIYYLIMPLIEKAKAYDIIRYKQSQGGRKSAQNMTAEERKARAKKASHARQAKKS